MATAKEYVDKAAKYAAQQAARAEVEARIASALTVGDIGQVCAGPLYGSVASVRFEVQTRAEAIELLRAYPPEPIAVVRDGCVGVRPCSDLERKPPSERAEVHDEILPAWWTFDPGYGGGAKYPATARLEWYSMLGADLIRCAAKIASDPARAFPDHARNAQGRITAHQWRFEHLPNGEGIRYASGDHTTCGPLLRYFFREPGGGATDLYDYLDVERPDGIDGSRFYGRD